MTLEVYTAQDELPSKIKEIMSGFDPDYIRNGVRATGGGRYEPTHNAKAELWKLGPMEIFKISDNGGLADVWLATGRHMIGDVDKYIAAAVRTMPDDLAADMAEELL